MNCLSFRCPGKSTKIGNGKSATVTYLRKPVQKAALRCGIEPPHGGVDDGVQQLFEHLLRSLESGGVLYDEGQKEDQSATNSNGCEDPNVKHGVFVGRRKLEVLSNERHVSVRESVVVGGRVQVMGGR